MPINTLHPSFAAMQDDLRTMRDVVTGEDAVKKAGVTYLPKLGGQEHEDYEAYKRRAQFYNATIRTLEALAGSIMRKAPVLHGPETWVEKYQRNVTGAGESLSMFAGDLVREALTSSMCGILVEHNGDRPFLSGYVAENIINRLPDGTIVLSELEWIQDPKDRFTLTAQTNYREIRRGERGIEVAIWKPDAKNNFVESSIKTLSFRGDAEKIAEIPFFFGRLNGMPLLALAQANLSHYLTSADLENGLHWGGIFTPWIAGADAIEGELRVGGSSAWKLPTSATVGMLEISGAALSALEQRLNGKQDLMTSLGARLLIAPKRVAETEATARINASSEGATLVLVVEMVESVLTNAVKMMARWDGLPDADVEAVHVELNRDFVDSVLSPQEITAYLGLYTSGVVDLETFLLMLRGGEVLPEGRTPEDIKASIEAHPPPMAIKRNQNSKEQP